MMMVFETIGLFIVALVCIVVITLLSSLFMSGGHLDDENADMISFICVIAVLLFIASIYFVQFRHYPEKFGYTAIEEVEEAAEETE